MDFPQNFWVGIVGSIIFGVIGIALLLVGFKLFDRMTPRVDFQAAMHNSPVASAIVVASFFVSLAYIIGSVVH